MIDSKELKHQITYQAMADPKTAEKDSFGAIINPWPDFVTVWSAIITTGGREFFAAQKAYAETTVVFKHRYISGLLPTMRIKYGNRIFNILGINNVNEANREMLISAKEVV